MSTRFFIVLTACVLVLCVQAKATATFERLIEIERDHDNRPAAKSDPVMEEQTAKWVADLEHGDLAEHWKRLLMEVQQHDTQSSEQLRKQHPSAFGLMRSLVFELAAKTKRLDLVVQLLKTEPVGFIRPLIRPEFHLVRSAGPTAMKCFFEAYEDCRTDETKQWLAHRVKASFGLLYREVWLETDTDDQAISKIRSWFNAHASRLRCAEVYGPVSAQKFYFDQGIQYGERLIGMFFLKNAE